MSKIGVKPIKIDSGTQVEILAGTVKVSGKEGNIEINVPKAITVEKTEDSLVLKRQTDTKDHKALHGLIRSLIYNAVQGVNKPWEKKLEVVGTGYRVKLQGADLSFEVGYSHPVVFKPLDGIKFSVEGNNKVTISGVDKQLVGQIAHQIKSVKKPDPYKGKGVRYEGETIKLKAGKKAKAAGGK